MTEQVKISELEKAIEDTRKALTNTQQEKKAAANDPERLVLAEKQERRINEQLKALEKTKTATTYTPPEPTDRAELMTGFQKYRDAKEEKLKAVNTSILTTEREHREITAGLKQAAEDCAIEKTLELSERKTELDSKLKHLYSMRERVKALPTFPPEAFEREWADICEKTLSDWRGRVLRVEMLATEYKNACASLLQMHDTLKAVRNEIERLSSTEGNTPLRLSPFFTIGIDGKKLTVQKNDYIRLSGLSAPLSGLPL